jgi:hypothetical protein
MLLSEQCLLKRKTTAGGAPIEAAHEKAQRHRQLSVTVEHFNHKHPN